MCCGQLVRLANDLPRLHALGADVVGVSVDRPARSAALARRWHLPFPLRPDAEGAEVLRPLGLWNAGEREGIGVPALLLVTPEGGRAYAYRGRDPGERPPHDGLMAALGDLGLPGLGPVPPWDPGIEPEESAEAFPVSAFGAYFRGAGMASRYVAGRSGETPGRAEGQAMADMAASFLEAWVERREIQRRAVRNAS